MNGKYSYPSLDEKTKCQRLIDLPKDTAST